MKRTVPPVTYKNTLVPGTAPVGTLRRLPPGDLHVLKNFNLRVEGTPEFEEGMAELVSSIEANGFYPDKPLAGYVTADDQVVVIDGHRRLAAVNRLNGASLDGDVVTEVPVIVTQGEPADLTIAMIQSASGVPLSQFERGVGIRRLMADGMEKDEIARRLGVSVKTVENAALVASAPAKARDLLLDGKVTYTAVMKAMRKPETAVERLTGMTQTAETKGRTRARQSDDLVEATTQSYVTQAEIDEAARAIVGLPTDLVTQDAVEPLVDDIRAEDLGVTITVVKDGDMGAVVRAAAAAIRERVPHDTGDEDLAHVNGVITITVSLEAVPKPKRVKRNKTVEDL